MKKLLLVLTVFIFSLTTFTGCKKKTEEAPQLLSEFIVGGEWVYVKTQNFPTHVEVTTYTRSFYAEGTYALSVSDGINIPLVYNGTYSIDDELNQLTISDHLYEEGVGDEFDLWDIEWQEGVEQMSWTNEHSGVGEEIVWNRNYND